MKFRTKLALGVTVLVCVAVTLCGTLLIGRSFHYEVREAERQFTAKQESIAYFLVNRTIEAENYKHNFADTYAVTAAAKRISQATGAAFALYWDSTVCRFAALPSSLTESTRLAAISDGADSRRIVESGDRKFMLLTAPLTIPGHDITMLSAFDVTQVFLSRDEQLRDLLFISLGSVALCAALAVLFARAVTLPLSRLMKISSRIAAGDYSERTPIDSSDEFGELSRSFDAMQDAILAQISTLENSMRQREDFVAAFTHELKTPMTSMLGYASLLQLKERKEGMHKKYADYILHETQRLERLSQKLLCLMGLKGNEALTFESVPVSVLFANVKKSMPSSNDNIHISFASTDLTVLCECALIEDLLRNLIANGIQACESAGVVKVGCELRGDYASLFVSDSGFGIPEDEISRITEPFYMIDKSRAHAGHGSGIGLALCERIAVLHGGKLEFESEVGVGTKVCLSLTLAHHIAQSSDKQGEQHEK